MKPAETFLHSANILVSTIGVVTAGGALAGVAPLVGGALSITALLGKIRPNTDGLDERVGAMLTFSLNNATTHLPQEATKIIPQMIEAGVLSPSEVMGAARKPGRICAAMLDKLKDPEHRRTDMQEAFVRVVKPILAELLNDPEVCNLLRPAFEAALAGSLAHIQHVVEELLARSDETAHRLGVQEGLLIGVAKRYAAINPNDFDSALAAVEQALEVAAQERERDRLPSNLPDAITAVIARVNALNDRDQLDAGKAAILAALADQRDVAAQAQAGQLRLITKGLAQAVLTADVEMAATLELERLKLDGAGFDALRAVWQEWHERGRDKGLRFDLEVAIALARASAERAIDADQRGKAANDLGITLSTLGERESGTARLEAAVTAYESALLEWSREVVPLNWAATQNNLGTALHTLGQRESGTARLEAAVTAYENALLEWTREVVPLNWAMTQNNLGTALQTLGQRESGTARLEAAVTAFENALLEWAREVVPLDWAVTQNNLGNALQTLGQRESGTARLEAAVTAYENALLERKREVVPLNWAATQFNLGLVEVVFAQKVQGPATAAHLRAALAHVDAALQVFDPQSSPFYFDKASRLREALLKELGPQ
jgi:tetratricopeptide (TPR) repeat protein